VKTELEALPATLLEVLRTRAGRLGAARQAEQAEASLPVAEFAVGGDRYALSLSCLRAVMPLRRVASVPLAPAHVLGILRFEDQLIVAMSLMALLGARGWRQDCATLLVVDAGEGHLVALDCEQVPQIGALPLSQVEQARAKKAGPVLDVAHGARQVGLIDVKALVEKSAAGATHG
jgi:chemotaxis signal transduction protein